MRVCGFSFIKNAVKFDFPFIEAIHSILPLCDKVVIAHGNSEDTTDELLRSLPADRVEIIQTTWDPKLTEGGAVLADETNKALDAIKEEYDWLFYIQGDEVVHEKDHEAIRDAMTHNLDNFRVEGLLFKYNHFYGSYDYIADSRSWYDLEVRIIRHLPSIRSYKDAQGFRKNGHKLKAKRIDATMYHYGWVKPPEVMGDKLLDQTRFRSDAPEEELELIARGFDYSRIDSLARFRGTHPAVMRPRIEQKKWKIELDTSKKKMSLKLLIHYYLEKLTGRRWFYFRNYDLIK